MTFIINPFWFATASGYRYIRLNVSAHEGADNYFGFAELDIFSGASNLTFSTFTASSSDSGSLPEKGQDDRLDTEWLTNNIAPPGWYACDLGAQFNITKYDITAYRFASSGRSPTAWTLEGNNVGMGTGDPWVVLDTRSGQTGWTNNEVRSFTL